MRLGLFPAISLLLPFFLQNSYASATSITLTIPSSPLSFDLNPSANNGFAKSSDATVKVSTNGSWGYELNVKAKTDNTLKNGSNKLDSIGTSIDENTFKTGTTYNNKWGFKPSKLSGSSNTNFVAAPTTSNTLIEKTSSANSSSPTSYTLAIAAKADGSLPTGKYSNNFTFSATANSVSYSITYELNGGQWTEANNVQSGSTTENSVNLRSTLPTRDNYEFQGWCTSQTSDENCSGTPYSAGAAYQLQNNANTVTLYARWKLKALPMQDFDCSSLGSGETTTLVDTRDGNTYRVRKLLDNKCWMIDNLKLGGSSSIQLTSTTSDVSSSYTLPASSKSGFSSYDVSNVYVPTATSGNEKVEYGGYYTWFAATAGTGTHSLTSTNATSSICPKNWRLPTGGSSGEFKAMTDKYGSSSNATAWSTTLQDPAGPNFLLAGFYSSGSARGQGSYGDYWSSTASGSTDGAYVLNLLSSIVGPADYYLKYGGYSVRCVAREAVNHIINYNVDGAGCKHNNVPNAQAIAASENYAVLDSQTPSVCGYDFKGWCSVNPTSNGSTSPSCSGQTYQPGQSVSLAGKDSIITLYAMWQHNGYTGCETCGNTDVKPPR